MAGFSARRWLSAGVVGSVVFWLFQILTTGFTIPQFLGEQITAQGHYSPALAPVVGWSVHLGVSLTYALLFAVIMAALPTPSARATLGVGVVLAMLLGWLTTLVTAPAIATTISLLSGQGFPADVPGLNTDIGLPLYNHVLFFVVVWGVTVLLPSLRRS